MAKIKQPLYLNIMEIIKERILTGVYPLHTNIPTETQLEEEFQVSKITIRKAITMLESEGFLEKRSGLGTKVVNNGIYNVLSRTQSFAKCLNNQGFSFTRKTVKVASFDFITVSSGMCSYILNGILISRSIECQCIGIVFLHDAISITCGIDEAISYRAVVKISKTSPSSGHRVEQFVVSGRDDEGVADEFHGVAGDLVRRDLAESFHAFGGRGGRRSCRLRRLGGNGDCSCRGRGGRHADGHHFVVCRHG